MCAVHCMMRTAGPRTRKRRSRGSGGFGNSSNQPLHQLSRSVATASKATSALGPNCFTNGNAKSGRNPASPAARQQAGKHSTAVGLHPAVPFAGTASPSAAETSGAGLAVQSVSGRWDADVQDVFCQLQMQDGAHQTEGTSAPAVRGKLPACWPQCWCPQSPASAGPGPCMRGEGPGPVATQRLLSCAAAEAVAPW